MYSPVKDGIIKDVKSVSYFEVNPPSSLADLVHCFWELKSQSSLPEDFLYHVLPDACVNILFDQMNVDIAATTALQTDHKKLNLGKEFHFIGVQLLPGVWRGDPSEIENDLVDTPYLGELSLIEVNTKLFGQEFSTQQNVLSTFILELIDKNLIKKNELITKILVNFDMIRTVADISRITELSTRQLQRKIREAIGISPHDFLKILRVHHSFKQHYLDYYSDQSHFIHSFRKITGYTPEKYSKKFNV